MASRRTSWLLASAMLYSICAEVRAAESVDFAHQVKPLLAQQCFACHGPLKQESNLRLDAGTLILAGGDSGPIVVPGHADQSTLIEMVRGGAANAQMPPPGEGTPLKPAEVQLLERWINEGANFPADDRPELDPREFWSYQPVERPAIPTSRTPEASKNPVDAFINARLAEHQLTPVATADPFTLLRRVYLDLTGLPPNQQQIEAFARDPSDAAYEATVDRLLQSPQYGERWGRHWMDVWRYSDWYGSTAANEIRNSQYHIWHWRDWIIKSLNEDKGYDKMVHEMLAADELAPADRDALRATGYLGRSWYLFNRTTWLIDTVEHANMAFLGVTMKCARCHDHKYDPIRQTDYYRFRAFFEPHDVRTDPYPGESDVNIKGLPRVYDKMVDAPTYLFQRGDERSPDKENPLSPGVAEAFGTPLGDLNEIILPVEARYLELQPEFTHVAEQAIKERLGKSQTALADIQAQLEPLPASTSALPTQPWRADLVRESAAALFQQFNPDEELAEHWEQLAGTWAVEEQTLRPELPAAGVTAYLATKQNHPQDFYTRLVYRPLEPGTYRSIGFSFDLQQVGDSQDIYTSTGDQQQSVQAFHRVAGKDVYPNSGIVKTDLQVGAETTLEVVARGRDLRIWLNGQLKLDYVMPLKRQPGRFAAWVYAGTAEFRELEIHALQPSPVDAPRRLSQLQLAAQLEQMEIEAIEAELAALRARVAAERAKYEPADADEITALAIAADKAEKRVTHLRTQRQLIETDHYLQLVANFDPTAAPGESMLLVDAEQLQTASQAAVEASANAMATATGQYQPLGEPYPAKSTGRRLALARWMTDRRNPRTARVAVNHIWLRHFGRAIVPTVADFGIRSQPRSHPLLLDWLAAELIESGWRMKPLHKLIVMSQAYRRSSAVGDQAHNLESDSDNTYLWRMNSRRLEAEAVRDSILFASEQLDPTLGGPTLPQTEGHTTFRRSMYYQVTPDNRMDFLAQFDVASPVQCYQRKVSVVPQQALALNNSVLAQNHARHLATLLTALEQREFITRTFFKTLSRPPTDKERQLSVQFLTQQEKLLADTAALTPLLPGDEGVTPPAADASQRARENYVQVLFNHNDFVTVR